MMTDILITAGVYFFGTVAMLVLWEIWGGVERIVRRMDAMPDVDLAVYDPSGTRARPRYVECSGCGHRQPHYGDEAVECDVCRQAIPTF